MLTLKGEPKSTQHIYKYTCRGGYVHGYMSADGKALKEDYQWQLKSQWRRKPIETPLQVSLVLYFATKRVHDVDNYSKIILDACNGMVWKDDGQIEELNIRRSYDPKAPRIELEFNELP